MTTTTLASGSLHALSRKTSPRRIAAISLSPPQEYPLLNLPRLITRSSWFLVPPLAVDLYFTSYLFLSLCHIYFMRISRRFSVSGFVKYGARNKFRVRSLVPRGLRLPSPAPPSLNVSPGHQQHRSPYHLMRALRFE